MLIINTVKFGNNEPSLSNTEREVRKESLHNAEIVSIFQLIDCHLIADISRCEKDIQRQVERIQSELELGKEKLLQELDKICSEMAGTIGADGDIQLSELSFIPREVPEAGFGFLALNGLLPSHLCLSFSSKLIDLKPGGVVLMEIEPVGQRLVKYYARNL